MDVYFKNVSTYTLEEYKKFVEFHNKKYNFRYNLYTLFIVALCIFCIVLQFCYGNIVIGIIFILGMVSFLCYRVLRPLFFIKKEANSKKIKNKMTNIYTFYRSATLKVKLKYSKFYKIYEENDRFYLYLDKNHSYILLKSGFTVGNVNEFYEFLKKRLRYRI